MKIDENSPAMKRRAQVMAKVFDHLPAKTAEDIRAIGDGLWGTTHNEDLDRGVMLQDLSLLSGMACAALYDYAKLLEEKERRKGDG